jgi:Domain of unknown function (DUF4260)
LSIAIYPEMLIFDAMEKPIMRDLAKSATSIEPGVVQGWPLWFLRLEGLALAVAAISCYWQRDGSWFMFATLILVPDLFMIGYLFNARLGSMLYNVAHTTSLPIAMGIAGWFSGSASLINVAVIILAHIGIDRMLGYGLKYPTHFRRTHLSSQG